jgi:toxin ParE1/3/4
MKRNAAWGERFTAAVEEAAALAFALSGAPSRSNTRRIIVKGFCFSIFYRPEPDGIVILAVADHARRPFDWRSRTRTR